MISQGEHDHFLELEFYQAKDALEIFFELKRAYALLPEDGDVYGPEEEQYHDTIYCVAGRIRERLEEDAKRQTRFGPQEIAMLLYFMVAYGDSTDERLEEALRDFECDPCNETHTRSEGA